MSRATPYLLAAFALSIAMAGAVWLSDSEWLRDAVRALNIVFSALLVLLAIPIVFRYGQRYIRTPGQARLKPFHVAMLGVFTFGMAASGFGRQINAVGSEFEWFGTPLLFPSLTAGVIGLYGLVFYLPHPNRSK